MACQKIIFVILFILVPFTAIADNKIAMLQFSNQDGWTQLVFQMHVESQSMCKKLNQNHWKGVKTYCQDCKIDFDGCVDKIPSSYQGIEGNKPIVFPYLSSRYDRIVYFGMPIETAKNICQEMASSYKAKLNRDAKCILP